MSVAVATDVRARYADFFARGGPPPADAARPWRYRRRDTSMGLPAVELLAALARERATARVLDLGSGLTSYILRAVASELPAMTVVTTDTSPQWLARTVAELERDQFNAAHCYEHATFEALPLAREAYDVVSVDIYNTPFRVRLVPSLKTWLAPDGVVLLDDWHMVDYRAAMEAALTALGLHVEPRPETTDEFGRFVALARWAI